MGGIDVASVVTSIISAFGSGLDIFQRLSGKKRKSNARLPRPEEEEEWLRHSLKKRPVEIKHEYDQQVAKFGRKFELGDGPAQSSLAHTLLVLNTGLINLINHALAGDSKTISTSQRALYSLSETAAGDTMAALAQLSSRLSLASPSSLALEDKDIQKSGDRHSRKSRHSSSLTTSQQTRRPPPTPLLVRGGWVRSKSGSSVVSVVSGASARKARTEHGDRHRRSKSDSVVVKSSPPSPDRPKTKHDEADRSTYTSNAVSTSAKGRAEGNKTSARHDTTEYPRPRREPSMLIMPADFFESMQTSVEKFTPQGPPPRPPKVPIDRGPLPTQSRIRPTSTMTFMTASTKIGEIPEARVYSNEEVQSRPVPHSIPPPLEPTEPRKKKGFKFWKREDKRYDIAAY
ncbi:hypothetical protein A1O7_07600 [Cladophialophora yegresii CBS 114405]|uniref:Uncharacterized protein n=1 Tax=Cladophialophora yegresii CBS 114405 TaxID=1182544 RepID=W9VNX9_9EURO|nr:uncharacterized protein A1O7_07600 [Cladophialophora yegresii CBS 114405]EXJ57253.1 hypothetical protein A1O7_07600 [Cladophialophora yegresii CBS 114405]